MDDIRSNPAWRLGYLEAAVEEFLFAYDEGRDIDLPIEKLRRIVRGQDPKPAYPERREGA